MRNKRLDILRCVAVLLVIATHGQIFAFTTRVGWVGVDLFFVLSGFLISGLLYTEYKKRQGIGVRRFFIRRGLKIYPAFYVLVAATYAAQHLLWNGAPSPISSFVRESLFVQNYKYGIWTHTWSLAVEEHFYIGLALLLLFLAKYSVDRSDPFRKIPQIFLFIAVFCLLCRILTIRFTPPADFLTSQVMNPTHTRIDGLFFGVFLGYLYHFRMEALQRVLLPLRNRIALLVLSAILLSTCYFFSRDSHFLLTFGLTFLYLGFGGLLLLSLFASRVLKGRLAAIANHAGDGCAYVGRHSYSIYLWHVPLLVTVPVVERKVLHAQLPFPALVAVYLVGSCALGIFLANLIEFPVLKMRERFFPMLDSKRLPGQQAPAAVPQAPAYQIPDQIRDQIPDRVPGD
jgi:peptidoglycan/LPS O-acetylase OafA/YrhL